VDQDRARQIMGQNYFGVEEAVKHFGAKPSEQELAALLNVPFSETTLEECQSTHLLIAVFPMSIVAIESFADPKLFFHGSGWHKTERFANDQGKAGWYLVRKTPVPDSFSKNWKKQQVLLKKSEEVPDTRVVVYAIISCYLATGERLFEKTYVHCRDGNFNNRIYIGFFDCHGLLIGSSWESSQSDHLGLASIRLPDAVNSASKD